MSDAHLSDRRPSADSDAVEVTSKPIDLGLAASRDTKPVDITPAPAPDATGPTRGSSGRRKIVLGVVLAVALTGVAVLGSVSWRILQQKDATLSAPTEIAGLTLDEGEEAVITIDYLSTAVNAELNFAETYGAVYADPAGSDRSVLLIGGTTLVWQPERDLDRVFDLASEEESRIADVREVDAGPLGGVMKCGTSPVQAGDVVWCGWADHGSVVMGMFPSRSVDESATLLRDIRNAVQTRG